MTDGATVPRRIGTADFKIGVAVLLAPVCPATFPCCELNNQYVRARTANRIALVRVVLCIKRSLAGIRTAAISFLPGVTRKIVTRGSVVVAATSRPDGAVVKRVVGVGGDAVRMDRGTLMVNGRPFADARTTRSFSESWPDGDGETGRRCLDSVKGAAADPGCVSSASFQRRG